VVPFFLLQGAAEAVVPRYFLPLVPYLCLAAGHTIDRAARRRLVLGAATGVVVLGYGAVLSASQCARIGAGSELVIAEALDVHARFAGSRGTPLVVAYPNPRGAGVDPVSPYLRRPDIRLVRYPIQVRGESGDVQVRRYRQWLDRESVDVVLLTSRERAIAQRQARADVYRSFLAALDDGRLGFVRIRDVHTRFLTQELYTWADPMLDTHLTAGIMGYQLYARVVDQRQAKGD
jgi:hypothetical protein